MPKMKTHKGTAKRVKITGTGKLMMMSHHRNNKRMTKRAEKLVDLRGMEIVNPVHDRRMKVLLPYKKHS
jgi:large subunit ribosomal protein L35